MQAPRFPGPNLAPLVLPGLLLLGLLPAAGAAPAAYAIGFDDVIVNGVPVIRAGTFGEARPGRPVRLQDS